MPPKPTTRSFYEAAVERAVLAIVTQLDESLDLGALARQAALSPFHFHRVFRGLTGETPLEMKRRLRLERAADQLIRGDEPVTRIAFDAGYETHEAFTRAFKQAYGRVPSAFRLEARDALGCAGPPSLLLAAPSGVHLGVDVPSTLTFSKGDPMNVSIESLPAIRLATLRHVGPYNRIGEAFARLGAIAGPAGLIGRPGTAMIALYHDDPETVPTSELRSDAAVSVPAEIPMPAGLSEVVLPAGRYAHATHVGPYEGLGDTWTRFLGQWLPASGHRIGTGSSYELYRNTPAEAPPAELRTELYVPLSD